MAPKRKTTSGLHLPNPKRPKRTKHAVKKKQSTTFFTLSPELRNNIYERALIRDKTIDVKQSFKEPGILQACHQTREEAREMWYSMNTFRVKVLNLDARLLIAFEKHAAKVSRKMKIIPYISMAQRNWSNLLRWCHEAHLHPSVRANYGKSNRVNHTRYTSAIFTALRMTWSHRRSKWATCKIALEDFRSCLGKYEKSWLVDYPVAEGQQ